MVLERNSFRNSPEPLSPHLRKQPAGKLMAAGISSSMEERIWRGNLSQTSCASQDGAWSTPAPPSKSTAAISRQHSSFQGWQPPLSWAKCSRPSLKPLGAELSSGEMQGRMRTRSQERQEDVLQLKPGRMRKSSISTNSFSTQEVFILLLW